MNCLHEGVGMGLTVGVARQDGTCTYCGEAYLAEEEVGVLTVEQTTVMIHTDCWGKCQKELLGKPVPRRGRKPLDITDEAKVVRNRLINQYAAIRYHLGNTVDSEKRKKMGVKLEGIKEQITQYGGMPRSWTDGSNQ